MAEVLPLKINTVYTAALAGRYVGSLSNRLSLYRPLPGEQGWAEIIALNFSILNTAALVDVNNDFRTNTIQRFLGRAIVQWPQYYKDVAPRQYVDTLALLAWMGV